MDSILVKRPNSQLKFTVHSLPIFPLLLRSVSNAFLKSKHSKWNFSPFINKLSYMEFLSELGNVKISIGKLILTCIID